MNRSIVVITTIHNLRETKEDIDLQIQITVIN